MKIIDIDGHGKESEMYAYISIDENGQSGICAGTTPLGLSPFTSMTRKDMKKWEPTVEKIRRETGKKIHLVRYVAAEIIQED